MSPRSTAVGPRERYDEWVHVRDRAINNDPGATIKKTGELETSGEVNDVVTTEPDSDVHRLLEQMARMCELLSKKEVELVKVRSELTFAHAELGSARE